MKDQVRIFGNVPKVKILKSTKYNKFIGKTLKVRGFSSEKIYKIVEVYGVDKKFPCFRCEDENGIRHNLLCRDVIKSGSLVKELKILSA